MYVRKFYARNKIEAMYGRPRVNLKVERGNVFPLNLKLKYFFFKKESKKRILAASPICLIPDQCKILTDAISHITQTWENNFIFKLLSLKGSDS